MGRRRDARLKFLPYLEYYVFLAAIFFVRMLPFHVAIFFGRMLGRFYYFFNHNRRKMGQLNLIQAFGNSLSRQKRERILLASFEHLGMSLIESSYFSSKKNHSKISKYFKFEGTEFVEEALQKGCGAILVTGHLGNWECAGLAMGLLKNKWGLHPVAKSFSNPYIEEFVTKLRTSTGIGVVKDHGAVEKIKTLLSENKVVALVADQHVKTGRIEVLFFNAPAFFPKTVAMFSIHSQTPIITCCTTRNPRTLVHTLCFENLIYPPNQSGEEEVEYLTKQWVRSLERYIALHPEQYLWSHRKWRHTIDYKKGVFLRNPIPE